VLTRCAVARLLRACIATTDSPQQTDFFRYPKSEPQGGWCWHVNPGYQHNYALNNDNSILCCSNLTDVSGSSRSHSFVLALDLRLHLPLATSVGDIPHTPRATFNDWSHVHGFPIAATLQRDLPCGCCACRASDLHPCLERGVTAWTVGWEAGPRERCLPPARPHRHQCSPRGGSAEDGHRTVAEAAICGVCTCTLLPRSTM
jgi:hypothetical protein